MEQKVIECITHPIKCKLLLELYSSGKATAKQLAEIYNDIPQATLYRYLKRMTNDGILKVVEENQVRGTIEKTYGVAINLDSNGQDMIGENSGDAYMQMFMQYVFGFVKRFQDYCKNPNIDILKDRSGFSLAPIYATDEELESAMVEYSKIIQPLYKNRPTADRKSRTLGLIISPPENYDK
ncbi:helix-turn-helix domain-containing protein [Clostridium intestinale]|uniref:Helix-turn-helix domain-containing protein n=1 Tax=Clostridium intestinale DSM 6191 TaxID=1121320 RepID=A0A1M5T6A0_9CLOT|nr:helix-turn-helix domain-containing protein [Clostridium intestinale]SHH46254.1 Helix-turn-helix domain-containing protein [Clostridium intestinale DSM 6191]